MNPLKSNLGFSDINAGRSYMAVQRHEIKYLIPTQMAGQIHAELAQTMTYDHYSKGNYYPVYTVYFDTTDYQTAEAKLGGVENRVKYRIRAYYLDRPNYPVMAEIKQRQNSIILKRRSPISMKQAQALLLGKDLQPNGGMDATYHEWRYARLAASLRPKSLVVYRRLAFENHSYPGLRITIDRDVSQTPVSRLHFNKTAMPVWWGRQFVVLEIKFHGFLPKFVGDLICKYNLTNEAVSKYVDGLVTEITRAG
ncbi:polyphosphate polymerase domain-containing protein [Candidatus Saccharibacteria bacterium]|nr:polyphosphate polymerase domain-containing protein [Candidatus Saccharibacteria bacterium]